MYIQLSFEIWITHIISRQGTVALGISSLASTFHSWLLEYHASALLCKENKKSFLLSFNTHDI